MIKKQKTKVRSVGDFDFSSLISVTGQEVATKGQSQNIKVTVTIPPKIKKKKIKKGYNGVKGNVIRRNSWKTVSIGSPNVQDDINRCTEKNKNIPTD